MKRILQAIIVIFFLFTLLLLLKVFLLTNFPDFNVYYPAASAYVHGTDPYKEGARFFTNFVYPPIVLLFFSPFLILPIVYAAKIWLFISFFCLFLSLYLLFKLESTSVFSKTNLFISSLIFLMFPLKFTLGMGQINIVILLFLTLAYYFSSKKAAYLGGLFTALALALKMFPVFILPYFLIKREWKLLI